MQWGKKVCRLNGILAYFACDEGRACLSVKAFSAQRDCMFELLLGCHLLAGALVGGREVFPQAGTLSCIPAAESVGGESCCLGFAFFAPPLVV